MSVELFAIVYPRLTTVKDRTEWVELFRKAHSACTVVEILRLVGHVDVIARTMYRHGEVGVV